MNKEEIQNIAECIELLFENGVLRSEYREHYAKILKAQLDIEKMRNISTKS